MSGAIVITGPTASGKTDLALQLATQLDVEIISADSAQVYRGMDIGTAKPDPATLASTPHHLIDIRDPEDPYSAANFRNDTLRLVTEIRNRNRVPLIVGGTMLYLKALQDGLTDLPEADQVVRDEILIQAEQDGWDTVHNELRTVDPVSAARIKPGDKQRLQRALEVFRLTGRSLTDLQKQTQEPCPFPLLFLAVVPEDRKVLHARIEKRFMLMLDSGFVEEVARLRSNSALHAELPAIKAVGYRQIWSHLAGEIDRQNMIDSGVAATRQLAKRQYTWLRSWSGVQTLATSDVNAALKIISSGTILE